MKSNGKLERDLYRTKYPWKRSHESAKRRCTNKKSNRYKNYGGRGIKCLITVEEIKELWFRDEAYDMKIPTIDRKDNDGNYTVNNCRFIEKSINSSKDKYKPVDQYNLQGNFIRSWKSATEIKRTLGYLNGNISSACMGRYKQAYGFIWRLNKGEDE